MSEVVASPFKRPECGNASPGTIKDYLGGVVNLQIVGTDPDIAQPINGSLLVANYAPGAAHTNDGTFMITIETDAATYYVSLEDGSDFIITPAQSTAYLGQWYPAKLLSVNVGSTGSFSVGY